MVKIALSIPLLGFVVGTVSGVLLLRLKRYGRLVPLNPGTAVSP